MSSLWIRARRLRSSLITALVMAEPYETLATVAADRGQFTRPHLDGSFRPVGTGLFACGGTGIVRKMGCQWKGPTVRAVIARRPATAAHRTMARSGALARVDGGYLIASAPDIVASIVRRRPCVGFHGRKKAATVTANSSARYAERYKKRRQKAEGEVQILLLLHRAGCLWLLLRTARREAEFAAALQGMRPGAPGSATR